MWRENYILLQVLQTLCSCGQEGKLNCNFDQLIIIFSKRSILASYKSVFLYLSSLSLSLTLYMS